MNVKNAEQLVVVMIDSFQHARAGTENQLCRILQGLSGRVRFEVITLRESPWLEQNAARLGVTARLFSFDGVRRPGSWMNLLRLIQHLRRVKPAAVHTYFPVCNILGVVAAKLAGVPCIYASRRDYGEWMSPRYLTATRWANRFVTKIVTNSERVRERTVEREVFPAADIQVIHNGIDFNRFDLLRRSNDLLDRLQIPRRARIAGIVANFRPMKRHETLLRAAPAMFERIPDLHLLVVGKNMTGEDIEARLRSMAKELRIEDRVHFAHSDGDLLEYLGLFDVGINCSEGEGLSNAVMEYMAARIPVVVADSGGNPDLVVHGETGLLFALDDHAALAREVTELLQNAELSMSLAEAGRRSVVKRFGMAAMLAQHEQLYGRHIQGESI